MAEIQSAELQQRLSILRQKAVDNTLTQDEMKEGIELMRGERKSAQIAAASSTRRAKVKAEIPSADDLLGELGA